MSQLNIPFDGTSILAEKFSDEDKLRLTSCDGFTCFEADGDYKIDSLFSEYVQLNDIQDPLVLPLIQVTNLPGIDLTDESAVITTIQEEFWPQGENNCCNLLKRGIFFFPHMHVPRYLFLLNPYAALQSAVVWTYSRVFGEDNIDKLKAQISVSPFSWLKNFKTFWDITLLFWTKGCPDKVHNLLGKNFNETVMLSAIESANLNINPSICYDPCFGIFAKETGLTIDFNAEKDNFAVKEPHKASAITNNSMFKGCFCFCCLKRNSNQQEQRKHLINECLPLFF
jgi:hypothetical protein